MDFIKESFPVSCHKRYVWEWCPPMNQMTSIRLGGSQLFFGKSQEKSSFGKGQQKQPVSNSFWPKMSFWCDVCYFKLLCQATFTSKWWSWTEGMMQSYGSIAAVPVSATGSKLRFVQTCSVVQSLQVYPLFLKIEYLEWLKKAPDPCLDY